ncbi:N1R/p28 family protein [Penguinpox virus]|uniref:N1R/p28 family protein n=1 Tax=Penguinpox virus TaxID=648998 RepID=A0A068EFG1_9POXV|nr:N1R/p28 family protein [Penguinpox virus]AID46896.1 N1R/p28 family protein [Penguinpox virus]
MTSYIIVNSIDDIFYRICYGNLVVTAMKDCDYINATKLCSIAGKEFYKWHRLEYSKELIAYIDTMVNTKKSVIKISTVVNGAPSSRNILGYYVHPLLVPHILSWMSAEYALKISKIVNAIYSKMYHIGEKPKN